MRSYFIGSNLFVADFMVHKSGYAQNMRLLLCRVGCIVLLWCVWWCRWGETSLLNASKRIFFGLLFCILLCHSYSFAVSQLWRNASIWRRETFCYHLPLFLPNSISVAWMHFFRIIHITYWYLQRLHTLRRFVSRFFRIFFVGNNKALMES